MTLPRHAGVCCSTWQNLARATPFLNKKNVLFSKEIFAAKKTLANRVAVRNQTPEELQRENWKNAMKVECIWQTTFLF